MGVVVVVVFAQPVGDIGVVVFDMCGFVVVSSLAVVVLAIVL